MKVIIRWMDGMMTTFTEVVNVREPVSSHPQYKIEGRTSQTFVNAVAVKSVEVFPEESDA